MRVAVTGGSGFIGTYVVEELERRGHETLIIDHHKHTDTEREVFLADVRDATAMVEVAAHVDAIIHLAAVLGTQETISNPRPAAETNILGALNIFEAANQYDLPLVYAGVGNAWMRDYGTGAYTISKTAAEDFVRMHTKYRRSRFSVVRPMNAYGPRQSIARPYGTSKVRKIMPAFICRALTGTDIEVYGDGNQRSDCVYVEDVAEVFAQTLEVTATRGPLEKVVEVGPRTGGTVGSIARFVAGDVHRYTGNVVGVTHLPMRPGEVPNALVAADVTTLEQIGMNADYFTPLDVGIERTVDWYAHHWLPSYLAKGA